MTRSVEAHIKRRRIINAPHVTAVIRMGTFADTCTCRTFMSQTQTASKHPGMKTCLYPCGWRRDVTKQQTKSYACYVAHFTLGMMLKSIKNANRKQWQQQKGQVLINTCNYECLSSFSVLFFRQCVRVCLSYLWLLCSLQHSGGV